MTDTEKLKDTPQDKKAAAESLGDTGGRVKSSDAQPDLSSMSVQHAEPEDAYLTGGQRNLQRRILGLNVDGEHAHRPVEQSPGLHSGGSFTGTANGETAREPDHKQK